MPAGLRVGVKRLTPDLATGLRAGRAAEVGRLAAGRADAERPADDFPATGRLLAGCEALVREVAGLAEALPRDAGLAELLRGAELLREVAERDVDGRELPGLEEPLREGDGLEELGLDAPFLDEEAPLWLRESEPRELLAPFDFQLPLRSAGLCSERGFEAARE